MGYSHYFDRPKTFSKFGFDLFGSEVRRIMLVAKLDGIQLAGWDGTGAPQVDEERVSFNGMADDRCETCSVPRVYEPYEWETADETTGLFGIACKTRLRPYDAVVVAVLLSLRHHFPEVTLGSDGGAEDLARGAQLYEEATGRKTVLQASCG